MFDDAHWAEVPFTADGITHLSRFNQYGESPLESAPKVLDLCCGFGRISAELARRGFAVTGVDITESYLSAEVPVVTPKTVYTEYGDYLGKGFTLAAFMLLISGFVSYILKSIKNR